MIDDLRRVIAMEISNLMNTGQEDSTNADNKDGEEYFSVGLPKLSLAMLNFKNLTKMCQ